MYFPVLMYHQIFDDSHKDCIEKHAIHINEFEKQISYLAEKGYRSITLPDIFNFDILPHQKKDPIIAITFDDGHHSQFDFGYRILKKHQFIGNFFITVGWVGTSNYVTPKNIEEMSDDGMSIQSHSMTHRFLSDLSIEDLQEELSESKQRLQQMIGATVDFLSLPGGFGSKLVLKMAREQNYRGLCTSVPKLNQINNSNFVVLDRLNITRNTSFDTFKKLVSGDFYLTRKLAMAYKFKFLIRQIIGNRLYYRLWSMYSKYV